MIDGRNVVSVGSSNARNMKGGVPSGSAPLPRGSSSGGAVLRYETAHLDSELAQLTGGTMRPITLQGSPRANETGNAAGKPFLLTKQLLNDPDALRSYIETRREQGIIGPRIPGTGAGATHLEDGRSVLLAATKANLLAPRMDGIGQSVNRIT